MRELRDVVFYTFLVLSLMTLTVYVMHVINLPYYFFYYILIALMFMPLVSSFLTLRIFKLGSFREFGVPGSVKIKPMLMVLSLVYPFAVILVSIPFAFILGSEVDVFMRDFVDSLKEVALKEHIPFEILILIILINLAIAPFINTLFAFGEEAGWRGYLYERIKQLYGRDASLVVTGSIWGFWHWPLILIFGYNYPNHPDMLGATLFLLFCIFVGIFLSWLKESSGNIIFPSLAHGAINAYLGFGSYIVLANDEIYGFPAGIPVIIATGILAALFYVWIRGEISSE